MSASCTLRGFAQDARGAINDVLDSFTLPVFGGFMLGGIILGLSSNGTISSTRRTGARERKDLSHWAGMSVLHCWPQS